MESSHRRRSIIIMMLDYEEVSIYQLCCSGPSDGL